jgi:hypothetical protein
VEVVESLHLLDFFFEVGKEESLFGVVWSDRGVMVGLGKRGGGGRGSLGIEPVSEGSESVGQTSHLRVYFIDFDAFQCFFRISVDDQLVVFG